MSRDNFVLDENVFSLDKRIALAELVARQSILTGDLKSILPLLMHNRAFSSSDYIQRVLTQFYKPELSDVMSFVFRFFDLNYFPDEQELTAMLFEKIAELNLSQAIHSRFNLFFLSDTTEKIIQLAADLEAVTTNRVPICALAGFDLEEREWVKKAITLAPADFMDEVETANDDRAIKTLFLTNELADAHPKFYAKLFAMWSPADVIKFYEQLNPDSGNEVQAKFRQMQIDRFDAVSRLVVGDRAVIVSSDRTQLNNQFLPALLPDNGSLTDTYIFQNQILGTFLSMPRFGSDEQKLMVVGRVAQLMIDCNRGANIIDMKGVVPFLVENLFHLRRFDMLGNLLLVIGNVKNNIKLNMVEIAIRKTCSSFPSFGYSNHISKLKSFFLSMSDKRYACLDWLIRIPHFIFCKNPQSFRLLCIPISSSLIADSIIDMLLYSNPPLVEQLISDLKKDSQNESLSSVIDYVRRLLVGQSVYTRFNIVRALACGASRFPDLRKKLSILISILLLEMDLVNDYEHHYIYGTVINNIYLWSRPCSSFANDINKLTELSNREGRSKDLLECKQEICGLVYSITQIDTLKKTDLDRLEDVLNGEKINAILREERSEYRWHTKSGSNTYSYSTVWSMVKYARLRLAFFTDEAIPKNSVLKKSIFRFPHQNLEQKRKIASIMRGLRKFR